MSNPKIPKRAVTAILQSLSAGVTPRVGLEYIAVGRKTEIEAILNDLDNIVADGGATFRLVLGRYGSGKSFLLQLIRNYALQRNFVVADADLSPVRRLTGTTGQGLGLYRELLNNLATRTRPDGSAFPALLERWISDIQTDVMKTGNYGPTDPALTAAVQQRIFATINQMEGMVHGFDFATVISAYWQGYQSGDDARRDAALRWLRGEYSTKAEAKTALGVRSIIDDASWYDYLKLLARFVKDIGYKGLVVFFDEAVNLYKISNPVSRQNNYERLLTIYNDALQGKAQYLGIIFSGTPQMVEDKQRGLFSYEALRSRLEDSRFATSDMRDLASPMIRLNTLTPEEVFVLLQRIRELHGLQYSYTPAVTDEQIQHFMNDALNRLGADQFLTPREVVRDFVSILNILQQHPDRNFASLVQQITAAPLPRPADPEALTPENEISDEPEQKPSPYSGFTI